MCKGESSLFLLASGVLFAQLKQDSVPVAAVEEGVGSVRTTMVCTGGSRLSRCQVSLI